MPAAEERISYLLRRFTSRESTSVELSELWAAVREGPDDTAIKNELESLWATVVSDGQYTAPDWNQVMMSIRERIDQVEQPPVKKIRFGWMRYAAAILIVLGVGAYLWNSQQKENRNADLSAEVRSTEADVAPGGNRAVLTLADGRKIVLDSAVDGKIATQDNATITKNGDRLIYQAPQSQSLSPLTYNTMATPRGGQYQLTLPDGSQVWLNAESSITYPTAFTGNKREVTVTGEVYFEVTKDALKPFIVQCKRPGHPEPFLRQGKLREGSTEQPLTIEVLGTHFNINAYKEEPTMKTTLLEGSVRLTLPALGNPLSKTVHTSLILKPGQQGQLTKDQRLSLAAHPDVEQVMAWKNGMFAFRKADLPTVMIQLSRWYNLNIQYSGTIPQRSFTGEIDRSLTLKQVLNGLSETRINYELKENTLIIHP